MRMARLKGDADAELAHYHCVSRVVDRRFALGEAEKEHFVKLILRVGRGAAGGQKWRAAPARV